jgi:hypothetical protein
MASSASSFLARATSGGAITFAVGATALLVGATLSASAGGYGLILWSWHPVLALLAVGAALPVSLLA